MIYNQILPVPFNQLNHSVEWVMSSYPRQTKA
uniref:Uncharacterized protein n=1 Tax=Vitis vinifera TaxID=29760 RepID=F6HUW1_VITVI